jgi:hypothetical protein
MLFTFLLLVVLMAVITMAWPLDEPRRFPERAGLDMRTSPLAKAAGIAVIGAVVLFFLCFR